MIANTSTSPENIYTDSPYDDNNDELLFRCWKHQGCGDCLHEDLCSWCPFTQSCIPNTYPIPLLAPAYNENICPHWTERWEIRTRPFGCQVSTITTLTAIVSVLSTVVLAILILLAIWRVEKVRILTGRYPGWAGRSCKAIWGRLKEGWFKVGGLFRWRGKGKGDDEDYVRGDGLPVVADVEGDGEREPLLRA